MPKLRLIVASGTGQRRLLEETVKECEKKGYVQGGRQEGGEWSSLLADNLSGGLFDENRLIIVESAALLGPMPENCGAMVERESDTIILLVYDADPSKLFPKEVFQKCEVLKAEEYPRWPRERQNWVSALAQKMNVTIDRDAVAMLVELLEDPEEIRGQLLSLSMLSRQGGVTKEDVEELCLDDGSRNLLKLLDSLCNGDGVTAVRSLREIAKHGDLFPLLSALHNRMRLAAYAAAYPHNGAAFAKALGARDYAWRMAGQAARKYGPQALSDFVKGLILINVEEKSGRGAGWFSLELLILELTSPAR